MIKIKQFCEGINDINIFKTVFLAGGGGSGKSYICKLVFGIGSGGVSPFGVKVVNSDSLFEKGLENAGISKNLDPSNIKVFAKQMTLRTIAKELTIKRQEYLINGMLPMIVDGTGRSYDKIISQAKNLRTIGYDTSMIFVNTTLDVSLERNNNRERKVPEDIVTKAWNSVQANIGHFQKYFGNNGFTIIDNSIYLDPGSPEAIDFSTKLFKIGMKHIESRLQNYIGIGIIELLRKTGGKYLSDLPE